MSLYFIGIGGIGMSAIARHYKALGDFVAGYDKTPSALTRALEDEGIAITYTDDTETIPLQCQDPAETLVVLTPAIPPDSKIWAYFRERGFRIVKRSVALGALTSGAQALCVAGTHGKTTTSTLLAHIMRSSSVGCSAFLGGISVNYETNYWSDLASPYIVTEADEFDRSFHQLTPHMAVVTSMDADHLDIYGTHAEVIKAFLHFASLVKSGGMLLVKQGLPVGREDVAEGVVVRTYSRSDTEADYHAENVRIEGSRYLFDVRTPEGVIRDIRLGLGGLHNVENAIASIALATATGVTADEIRLACETFRGNKRRFEIYYESDDKVLMDDYAHHPQEIRATIRSLRELYPERRLIVCFQPHLYTRTRDLAGEFSEVLSLSDRVLLLPIYPARELPIEGVSSEVLLEGMRQGVGQTTTKESLARDVSNIMGEGGRSVVVVMGAGDIELLVPEVLRECFLG